MILMQQISRPETHSRTHKLDKGGRKTMEFFDSHCHLDDERFDEDREKLIAEIKRYPQLTEKNRRKLGWTITFVTLLCIYITESTITSQTERRLINSVIIFSSTFSYLYFLARLEKK